MKQHLIAGGLTAALILASCAREELPVQQSSVSSPKVQRTFLDSGVPGVAEVLFSDSFLELVEQDLLDGRAVTKSAALNDAMESLGILYMERIFPESPDFEEQRRAFGLHRWYRVRFRDNVPVSKVADGLMSTSGILQVNPVWPIVKEASFFNDPYLADQWHYVNNTVTWADINVLPVWENYTTGSEDVIVAVVDEGVQLNHPDLSANCIPGGPEGSQSFMKSATNPNTITVGGDHGTHVAGTISAINNNGKGVSGIAGGDSAKGIAGVKIMSCQIFNGDDSNADTYSAIVWGAEHGAVISQNSWGFQPRDKDGKFDEKTARELHEFYVKSNSEAPDALKSAIDYFNSVAGMKAGKQVGPMAGGVVFFAAGNDGARYGAPGCYPGAISVGAIQADGTRASFSNYGDWVDIAAPGANIMSTASNGSYAAFDGTSMACPHVSGVAALVVSYCGGEGFTRDQLVEKILGGANSTDFNVAANNIGPLVDALGAVLYGTGNPPKPVSGITCSVNSNNVTAAFKITADTKNPELPAYGFRIFAAKSKADLESMNPMKPSSGIKYGSVLTEDRKIGDDIEVTVSDLSFDTPYYVAVSAFDYGRNFSAISEIKAVTTGSNHAPEIVVDHDGEVVVHSFETLAVPVSVTDPDSHALTVTYSEGSDYAVWSYNTVTNLYTLTITGRNSKPGVYTANIKADDPYGLSKSMDIKYTIMENQKPVIVKPFDNVFLTGMGEKTTVQLNDFISDPDGEDISYTISMGTQGVAHISQNGSVLTITAITSSGSTTVNLTGQDSGGESVSGSFGVLVRPKDVVFESYPNPVVDILYVATGEESTTATIRLYSATGNKVYETVATCDAFHPAQVDMTAFAPGRYTLEVSYSDVTDRRTIIKR